MKYLAATVATVLAIVGLYLTAYFQFVERVVTPLDVHHYSPEVRQGHRFVDGDTAVPFTYTVHIPMKTTVQRPTATARIPAIPLVVFAPLLELDRQFRPEHWRDDPVIPPEYLVGSRIEPLPPLPTP